MKSNLVKYPRTKNLPWSNSNSSDDVWLYDCDHFEGKEVVVTSKLDGENTSCYRDHIHARSLDTQHHPSRNWIKQFHARWAYEIPENYRICGENLYAYHSIFYSNLPTYFFVFGVYDDENRCVSWGETLEICDLLGLQTVPILYQGEWDENKIRSLAKESIFDTYESDKDNPKWPEDFKPTDPEGYVVRIADSFHYDDFKNCCSKYVRSNHVRSSQNWMTKPVIPNLLK